jgi:hypothetical protein
VPSAIDGTTSSATIVDMAGMPEGEDKGVLHRLARLGLISALIVAAAQFFRGRESVLPSRRDSS